MPSAYKETENAYKNGLVGNNGAVFVDMLHERKFLKHIITREWEIFCNFAVS
jgi:hypothetical protein